MPTHDQERLRDDDPGRAAARLAAVSQRVRAARGASEDHPAEEARRLASIERDLLAVSGELVRSDPDIADDRGHPVLAEVGRWRSRRQAADLPDEARRAGRLLAGLVDDESTRWRETAQAVVDRGSAQDAFDLLCDASVLDQEAMRRRGARPGTPPLRGDRAPLRAALVEKVAADPPSDAVRERWVTDLLDRADVVLTGIDELDRPRRGRSSASWRTTSTGTSATSRSRRGGGAVDSSASSAACAPRSRSVDSRAASKASSASAPSHASSA